MEIKHILGNRSAAKIAALFVALMVAVGLTVAVSPSPAFAGFNDSFVWHQSPDEGFDDPITVYCESGQVRHLVENQYSKYTDGCGAVSHISVLAGRKVVCDDKAAGLNRRTYGPGVHYVGDKYLELRCVHQLA